jgi:DNA-binding response OmpR family regulator
MKPILYMVDDETDFQTIVRSWLEPQYSIVALKDGDELLGAFKTGKPDLVMLDLKLPGADGFELCRRIRETPGSERVPILFLTGSHEYSDYRKNMRAGGNAYITKPVGRRQLLAVIEELLGETKGAHAVDTGGGD